MLIEFRVTNYRSIRETQTLSMVASKDTTHAEATCIETGISAIPQVLRSAILYGPNASGKSNLISALSFMRSMVETSAAGIREGQSLNVAPFRFDSVTSSASTEFEVSFLENGIRYQYGFALTSTRVTREWLLAYVERKAQRWFEREYDEKQDQYNWYFGSHLTGGNQRQVWKDSTRANALFLSTAVNLNSEQLRPIFNWFVNKLIVISNNQFFYLTPTIERIKNATYKSDIIKFLQAADFGIIDVIVETKKRPLTSLHRDGSTFIIKNTPEQEFHEAKFLHQGKEEPITFDFADESHGTQRLFSYAGPVLDVLENGKTLVIDELDSSLHTKMVRFLVNLMYNSELNKNNAQLIFTSHNTSLLDTDLFRRDQIWFIERTMSQHRSFIRSLTLVHEKGRPLKRGI